MRNERTSNRVAKIAGRILAIKPDSTLVEAWDRDGKFHQFRWSDIRALAASALTQAPDKPKKKRGASKRP